MGVRPKYMYRAPLRHTLLYCQGSRGAYALRSPTLRSKVGVGVEMGLSRVW